MGTPGSRGRAEGRAQLIDASPARAASPTDGATVAAKRWLRSYGRRKGRKLSPRQSELLSRGLANHTIDMSRELRASELTALFPEPVREVWLEIGFGAGEHLVWQAEQNPQVGLIGAEPYVNGVVAALSALEARASIGGRVRIHPEDALSLLNWLSEASLSRAFVLFPDPWPKKRHRERRIFSPMFLDKLARVLCDSAELRFASDIADYAQAAIACAEAHPDFEVAHIFGSANRASTSDWPVTRYEEKASREGRSSTFVSMRRRSRR